MSESWVKGGVDTAIPGTLTELDADSLLHSPLWREDGHTLLLVVHESAPQPRVASVYLVQPRRVLTLME